MSIFEDYPFLIPFISVIIALSGIVITFYIFRKTSRDKAFADQQTAAIQTESLARQKQKDEIQLAREIKDENKRLALDVKEAMVNHMSTLLSTLKQDIELQKTILLSEINLMKQTDTQITKDLTYFVHNQQQINDRMQKNIDFMTQFMWGAGAKSDPAYLSGEIETQAHKNKPGEGLFKDNDSTETQKTKDERRLTSDQRKETAKQRQETQDQYQETRDQQSRKENK